MRIVKWDIKGKDRAQFENMRASMKPASKMRNALDGMWSAALGKEKYIVHIILAGEGEV